MLSPRCMIFSELFSDASLSSIRSPNGRKRTKGKEEKKNPEVTVFACVQTCTATYICMHPCTTESCIKYTLAVSVYNRAPCKTHCSQHIFSSIDVYACATENLVRMIIYPQPKLLHSSLKSSLINLLALPITEKCIIEFVALIDVFSGSLMIVWGRAIQLNS